ncbi:MAG: hypothetical protein GWN01_01890 [Nitrosopumilaceae archaeon]|nr:hypothetical protein [Nitrosopumilaceae archaeon]NIT99724.1 hypothetical protein [Nitrosopumilaceae archaeon]NIU88585.1 hypothetical protein [Nitrosopumilaceae archaeon]NIV64859.1 hypothetical protein [Nitrosopumilaceae archaeon]NIX60327.1 hypothetical protein [Nitrosopumilaceae archaeon]
MDWKKNHTCNFCSVISNEGRLLYDAEKECGIFKCANCKVEISTLQNDVPFQTEFKKLHKCNGVCQKTTKTGMMTYCERCEGIEFVCPFCYQGYFDKLHEQLDERYYISNDEIFEEPKWEEIVFSCVHVINNEKPIFYTDPMFHNPKIAMCKECEFLLENPENIIGKIDFEKMFCKIESKKLGL